MCIETGTRFVGKFTMTMYRGIRELLPKFGNELHERRLLCVIASVLWGFAVGRNATDVAHPDRVFVLPYAVGPTFMKWSSHMHRTIEINHEVITNIGKSSLQVPTTNISHAERFALRRSRAMNDNFVDVSQSV